MQLQRRRRWRTLDRWCHRVKAVEGMTRWLPRRLSLLLGLSLVECSPPHAVDFASEAEGTVFHTTEVVSGATKGSSVVHVGEKSSRTSTRVVGQGTARGVGGVGSGRANGHGSSSGGDGNGKDASDNFGESSDAVFHANVTSAHMRHDNDGRISGNGGTNATDTSMIVTTPTIATAFVTSTSAANGTTSTAHGAARTVSTATFSKPLPQPKPTTRPRPRPRPHSDRAIKTVGEHESLQRPVNMKPEGTTRHHEHASTKRQKQAGDGGRDGSGRSSTAVDRKQNAVQRLRNSTTGIVSNDGRATTTSRATQQLTPLPSTRPPPSPSRQPAESGSPPELRPSPMSPLIRVPLPRPRPRLSLSRPQSRPPTLTTLKDLHGARGDGSRTSSGSSGVADEASMKEKLGERDDEGKSRDARESQANQVGVTISTFNDSESEHAQRRYEDDITGATAGKTELVSLSPSTDRTSRVVAAGVRSGNNDDSKGNRDASSNGHGRDQGGDFGGGIHMKHAANTQQTSEPSLAQVSSTSSPSSPSLARAQQSSPLKGPKNNRQDVTLQPAANIQEFKKVTRGDWLRSPYVSQARLDRLWNYLFSTYYKEVPPVPSSGGPIGVGVGINVVKFKSFDEVKGIMNIAINLQMCWADERLAFKAKDFFNISWDVDGDKLPIRSDLVWTPDVTVMNEVGGLQRLLTMRTSPLVLADDDFREETGVNLLWSHPLDVRSNCEVDMSRYPFDEQTCYIAIGSWASSRRQIKLVPQPFFEEQNTVRTSEFKIKDITSQQRDVYSKGAAQKFNEVVYSITLKRFPHFYVVNYILPMVAMTLLTVATMWMSSGNVGPRINSGTKMLLCVVSIIFITARSRPPVSGDIWMDRFQSHCLALSMAAVLESLFIDWFSKIAVAIDWMPSSASVDLLLRSAIAMLSTVVILADATEVQPYVEEEFKGHTSFWLYSSIDTDSTRLLACFVYMMFFGLILSSVFSITWLVMPKTCRRSFARKKTEELDSADVNESASVDPEAASVDSPKPGEPRRRTGVGSSFSFPSMSIVPWNRFAGDYTRCPTDDCAP